MVKIEFYTVKEFSLELGRRGMNCTEKAIVHYIARGKVKAQKDILRPSKWLIPATELERVMPK